MKINVHYYINDSSYGVVYILFYFKAVGDS